MPPAPLTPRQVCQVLRDIALGVRSMSRISGPLTRGDLLTVDVDGWRLTFQQEDERLGYCTRCHSPEGQAYVFDARQPYGTDPIELLSTWEHQRLESLLRAL